MDDKCARSLARDLMVTQKLWLMDFLGILKSFAYHHDIYIGATVTSIDRNVFDGPLFFPVTYKVSVFNSVTL